MHFESLDLINEEVYNALKIKIAGEANFIIDPYNDRSSHSSKHLLYAAMSCIVPYNLCASLYEKYQSTTYLLLIAIIISLVSFLISFLILLNFFSGSESFLYFYERKRYYRKMKVSIILTDSYIEFLNLFKGELIIKNYYKILNVGYKTTNEEIKNSFDKAVVFYNPYTNKGSKSRAQFSLVKESYDILSSKGRKQDYDSILECFLMFECYASEYSKEDLTYFIDGKTVYGEFNKANLFSLDSILLNLLLPIYISIKWIKEI